MEKNIRIVIVDDEVAPRKNLKQVIKNYSKGFSVVGEADNALSGLKQIISLNPQLVILDVEMPGGNGFELLDCITKKDIAVIFSTAHNEYAIKAFRYNAVDYILKPLDIDLFLLALEKARELICLKKSASINYTRLFSHLTNDGPVKLAIHSQNEIEYIEMRSIVRMEGSGCYTYIYLENGRQLIVSKAIGEYEDLLPDEDFIRVHKSHVINMLHIKKFMRKDGLSVKMTDNYPVPIAVRRRDSFEQRLRAVAI